MKTPARAWFNLIRATDGGSVREIQYFDKAATRRTVIIQKERRIVPVDHLAGTGVVRVEKVEDCISVQTCL